MVTHRRRPLPRPAGPRMFLIGTVAVLALSGFGGAADPATASAPPAPCGATWTPVLDCD
ncbi:hypothetical protein [Pseudonocardia parietis]|uniref:Uncharacterized protein n=1 Tax=Pseudonocardia parietis TaxID=570936 RepID=A0ABS4W3Y0_9PSEU|nr:hypothetical protein [Pseudonocardia parietis]MBP2370855.1 hypothetical protein [Pseudonocardia parietis]